MSSRPRVKVTLSDETYETIRRLSDLNGKSMSMIVGELIEAVSPGMASTLALLEAADDASDETKIAMIEAMDQIQEELISSLGKAAAPTHRLIAQQRELDLSTEPRKKARLKRRGSK